MYKRLLTLQLMLKITPWDRGRGCRFQANLISENQASNWRFGGNLACVVKIQHFGPIYLGSGS